MSQLLLTLEVCDQWVYLHESARFFIMEMIEGEPFEEMPERDLRHAYTWLRWAGNHYHDDQDFDELILRLGQYLEGAAA